MNMSWWEHLSGPFNYNNYTKKPKNANLQQYHLVVSRSKLRPQREKRQAMVKKRLCINSDQHGDVKGRARDSGTVERH